MRAHIALFIMTAYLCSCSTAPRQSATATNYQRMSVYQLWVIQESTSSQIELLMAEAELGARGQTRYGTSYLGKRTHSLVGRSNYSRNTRRTSDKDCNDFQNAGAAQRFFLLSGGPVRDPHDLDRDGDGNACEWGTTLRSTYAVSRPVIRSTRRVYSRPTCHRGPRGGTYTITASGRKNYGGC